MAVYLRPRLLALFCLDLYLLLACLSNVHHTTTHVLCQSCLILPKCCTVTLAVDPLHQLQVWFSEPLQCTLVSEELWGAPVVSKSLSPPPKKKQKKQLNSGMWLCYLAAAIRVP